MAEDKLDKLTALVNQLTDKLDSGIKSMEEKLGDMQKKVNSVETNIDQKIDSLRASMNSEIQSLRADIQKEVKERVDEEVGGVADEIKQLREKLEETDSEMKRLKALVDVPFPPDQSLVLYGLPEYENETEYDTLNWLFNDILEVNVTIVVAMRLKPRDNDKLGVVKVQLETTAQKIEVLRAKKKCEDNEDAEDIVIKACESHDARVGRLNAKLLLSKLPDGKDYYITGHGLIRKKDSNDQEGGSRERDDAEKANGGNNGGTAEGSGDNRQPRESSGQNTNGDARKTNEKSRKKRDGSRGEPKPAEQGKPKKDDRNNNKKTRGPTEEPSRQSPRIRKEKNKK